MKRFTSSQSSWALAAATAGATALAGAPVRRVLLKWGVLDIPNHRSSHQIPTPRGGGIAALLGATAATLVVRRRFKGEHASAVTLLAALGLVDDISGHVRTPYRLVTQLVVGGTALGQGGWDRPLSAIVTASVVNIVNFMDGINGISGLTAMIWGINAMILDDESDGDLATLGALAAGAGLGFLPHNLPSAKLFLGDVGSYGLGATVAAGILSQRTLKGRYRVAAPLLPYGSDAGLALLRKVRKHQSIGAAHRDHVYQRLTDRGYSHTQVALFHAVAAVTAAFTSRQPLRKSLPYNVVIVIAYLSSAPSPNKSLAAIKLRGRDSNERLNRPRPRTRA